jgi:hypothetical protein
MAKQSGSQAGADNTPQANTSDGTVNAFNKGMVKDYDVTYAPDGTWNHARNAINNSKSGDVGLLGNEPANEFCTQAPYTIIGTIPIFQDYFAIFSTDDTNSEIGLFHEPSCTYIPIVNDPCLNFNRENLIIGDAKTKFDCSWDLYWDDGLNVSRKLNIGPVELDSYPNIFNNEPWPGVPYVCNEVQAGSNASCTICENVIPLTLNCEKIRLNKRMLIPCVTVSKGLSGGQLRNGSYYAVIAYSENQQRVTDYFSPSNIQALFSPNTSGSSLNISFSNLDTENFTEFQLVVVHTTDQQTVASQVGFYSTQTHSVSFDYVSATLTSIPLSYIPLRTPGYDKSEAMYDVNGYLIRVAPTEKFDFNYQPFANQIETEWIMVEQPWDYYRKGGSTVGYMRDEVYAFWIRFVYSDGKKSSSYHIPGREAFDWELNNYSPSDLDNIEYAQDNTYQTKVWEVINTAYPTNLNLPLNNAPVSPGEIVASGKMGYWESTEQYPNNNPEVWDASSNPSLFTVSGNNPAYDLCGKQIRHHKMPSDFLNSNGTQFGDLYVNQNTTHIRVDDYFLAANGNLTPAKPKAIRLLGVRFGNIKAPRDNQGNIIPGVVGYEILRASRQGNKTVVAKGAINNMRSYREAGAATTGTGAPFGIATGDEVLYPNYVGNYLGSDYTLTTYSEQSPSGAFGSSPQNDDNGFLGGGPNSVEYKSSYLTFHSPDTNLEYPFLSVNELKLYGQLGDKFNMQGQFEAVPGHPREKLITNRALVIAAVVGLGIAAKAVRGQRVTNQTMPLSAPVSGGTSTALQSLIPALAQSGADALAATPLHLLGAVLGGAGPLANPDENAAATAWLIAQGVSGTVGLAPPVLNRSLSYEDWQYVPALVSAGSNIITFAYYWSQGTDSTLDLMYALAPYRDYVLRSLSHLNLHKMQTGNIKTATNGSGNTRRLINDISYLKGQFQFIGDYKVNNLFRPNCVAIHLGKNLGGNIVDNPVFMQGLFTPTVTDNSIQTVGNVITNSSSQSGLINRGITTTNYTSGKFFATTSCMYGALKIRLRNQYGQIESANQITTGCAQRFKGSQNEELTQADAGQVVVIQSPAIFGGDTYVGRYTEKNTFFYFYDWLYDVPAGTELDYTLKYMITYPRFWADFTKFSSSEFMQSVTTGVLGITTNTISNALPSGKYNLDEFAGAASVDGAPTNSVSGTGLNKGVIGVLKGAMYLFQSGVRDFFVESEYNIDLREEGELPEEKFYNPYGFKDLKGLFDTNIIKFGNYFNYDISLGVSRTMNNYITWGSMQNRSYNPLVAETCFQYYPTRVIYSLPANAEDKKDYWQIFLVNNYYDFDSRVTAFKSINRNGAIILQEKASPVMFNAVDSLQTTAGTKITIGDGGLFSQPLQTLSNADIEFQHGSCQDRLSVINTPAGVYWMSASQGKIFTVAEGMQPISDSGMKWWFSKYLHYFLLDQFPDFPLVGNPVVGIGCQTTFDNDNQILYFSKTDYKVKDEFLDRVTIQKGDQFYFDNNAIELGNPIYFDNLSWTISFDPKIKAWLSFHDWHPELGISNIKGFLTTKTDNGIGKIWKHYNNTSKFCNYYGADYPFEIDYISATGQTITTTRSIEYLLECYVYDKDGIDRYEVLDFNFDRAIVYNNEQVSGNLRLNLSPKNNAPVIVNYPQIDATTGIINILFSKEEQKYRFNQFWDFTRNRGEFQTGGILVQQPVWNTELNGYIRTLNNNNINLNKSPFERKKFRHYANHVVLIRTVSDNVKMLLKVTNNKLLNSPR